MMNQIYTKLEYTITKLLTNRIVIPVYVKNIYITTVKRINPYPKVAPFFTSGHKIAIKKATIAIENPKVLNKRNIMISGVFQKRSNFNRSPLTIATIVRIVTKMSVVMIQDTQ